MMASSDGSIAFDSSINQDGLNRDLSEMEEAISDAASAAEQEAEAAFGNMQRQAQRIAQAYQAAGMDASSAMQQALRDVQQNADALGTNASRTFAGIGTDAEEAGDSIEEALSGKLDDLSGKFKDLLVAAGIATTVDEITEVGVDYEKSMNQVKNSTGAVGKELENLQEVASNIYVDGFGESMEDAATALTDVYDRTGLTGDALQAATEKAYSLQDLFGLDLNESLQAASQLMANFGVSAEEAYNLMAQGAQKGLNQNGDMLDTLNEYSVQFANLGYSAEDMFNMLANGVESGTWSVDKLGDAVKEVNIRLNDGTADEALETLGLNLDNVKGKLAAGGTEAQSAMQEIITALYSVEDEQERYTLGQELMGTMWEDLGEDAVKALTNTQGEISKTTDIISDMATTNDDNLESRLESLKRKVQMEVIVPITKKYLPEVEKAIDYVAEHLDEIVQYATPIAAALASAFAVTKIVEFGTTAVKTIKTVKTAFMALNTSNPLGWVALGVTAVVSGLTALARKEEKQTQEWKDHLEDVRDAAAEIPDEVQESIDKTEECSEAWDSMRENMKASKTSEDYDYESVTKLKDSLAGLINADGTIKAGAEEKVSNIIDQLNQYSDTGLSVSDGIIEKNGEVVTSYNEISDSIDNAIEKQHAQNYLDSMQESVNEANEQRSTLVQNAADINQQLEEKKEERKQLIAEMESFLDENRYTDPGTGQTYISVESTKKYEEMQSKLEGLNTGIKELAASYYNNQLQLREGTEAINLYNDAMEDFANGDYEGITENYNKISYGFLTSATASQAELQAQYESMQAQYDTMKKLAEENPGSVTAEELAQMKQLVEDSKTELALATADTGTQSGAELMESLQNSAMSNGDKMEAISSWISSKLQEGMSLDEIGDELGLDFDSGLGEGVTSGTAFEEALEGLQTTAYNKAYGVGEQVGNGAVEGLNSKFEEFEVVSDRFLWNGISAMERAGIIRSPSHVTRDKVGKMLGAGVAVGLEQSEPEVEQASTDNIQAAIAASEAALYSGQIYTSFADAAIPETLGLMDAKVRSSVSAYNPVFAQAATAANQAEPVQTVTNSSNDSNLRDIVIPVQIGDETLDTIVVNAIARANANSGGWSV